MPCEAPEQTNSQFFFAPDTKIASSGTSSQLRILIWKNEGLFLRHAVLEYKGIVAE